MTGPRRATTRLSSDEIRRMADASREGRCVDCARLNTELEASRRELHSTHKRIHELEGQLHMFGAELKRLTDLVYEFTGHAP